MMDIVDRLRDGTDKGALTPLGELHIEAAIEITRLRNLLQNGSPVIEGVIQHQAAEIMRLKQELAKVQEQSEPVKFGKSDDIHHLAENIMTDCGVASTYDVLREKIEGRLWDYFDTTTPKPDTEIEKDAARYRWLRRQTTPKEFPFCEEPYWSVSVQQHGVGHVMRGEKLDAAIDAAMGRGE